MIWKMTDGTSEDDSMLGTNMKLVGPLGNGLGIGIVSSIGYTSRRSSPNLDRNHQEIERLLEQDRLLICQSRRVCPPLADCEVAEVRGPMGISDVEQGDLQA